MGGPPQKWGPGWRQRATSMPKHLLDRKMQAMRLMGAPRRHLGRSLRPYGAARDGGRRAQNASGPARAVRWRCAAARCTSLPQPLSGRGLSFPNGLDKLG